MARYLMNVLLLMLIEEDAEIISEIYVRHIFHECVVRAVVYGVL